MMHVPDSLHPGIADAGFHSPRRISDIWYHLDWHSQLIQMHDVISDQRRGP